jgi:5'-3' exonuclease
LRAAGSDFGKLWPVRVYLIDGTYELFRQYYGLVRRAGDEKGEPGATRGVVRDVISILASGVTHLGVATDHVIESFRNDLWPGYKTSEGVPSELLDQFPLLEASLEDLGVTVWPMVELEADDALASAAARCAADPGVDQVVICTPDKDLAQCVVDGRVVQVDRRRNEVRDEEGVWEKFGVAPTSIPDWLALVGDSADGFPGLSGWGKRSASAVLARYGNIEAIPEDFMEWDPQVRRVLRGAPRLAAGLVSERDLVLLFKDLATLRVDESLLGDVDDLEWTGPTAAFEKTSVELGAPELPERVATLLDGR